MIEQLYFISTKLHKKNILPYCSTTVKSFFIDKQYSLTIFFCLTFLNLTENKVNKFTEIKQENQNLSFDKIADILGLKTTDTWENIKAIINNTFQNERIKFKEIAEKLDISIQTIQTRTKNEAIFVYDIETFIEELRKKYIRSLQNRENLDFIIVPTEKKVPQIDKKNENTSFEKNNTINKLSIIINILEEIGIKQIEILEGENGENYVRNKPYYVVVIPRLGKSILACDQYGESSFIIHNAAYQFEIYKKTKSELNQDPSISRLKWNQDIEKWKQELLYLLNMQESKTIENNEFIPKIQILKDYFLEEITTEINLINKNILSEEELLQLNNSINIIINLFFIPPHSTIENIMTTLDTTLDSIEDYLKNLFKKINLLDLLKFKYTIRCNLREKIKELFLPEIDEKAAKELIKKQIASPNLNKENITEFQCSIRTNKNGKLCFYVNKKQISFSPGATSSDYIKLKMYYDDELQEFIYETENNSNLKKEFILKLHSSRKYYVFIPINRYKEIIKNQSSTKKTTAFYCEKNCNKKGVLDFSYYINGKRVGQDFSVGARRKQKVELSLVSR